MIQNKKLIIIIIILIKKKKKAIMCDGNYRKAKSERKQKEKKIRPFAPVYHSFWLNCLI